MTEGRGMDQEAKGRRSSGQELGITQRSGKKKALRKNIPTLPRYLNLNITKQSQEY